MAKKQEPKTAFEQSQLDAKRVAALDQMNRLLRDMYDYTGEVAKQAGVHADAIEDLLGNYTDFRDTASAILAIEKQIVEAEKKGKKNLDKKLKGLVETLKVQRGLLKVEQERQKVEKRIVDLTREHTKSINDLAGRIPVLGGILQKQLNKKIQEFGEELSIAMVRGETGLKQMGSTALKVFGKRGMLMLGIAAIAVALYGLYKVFSDIDELVSETARNLGMSKDSVISMANYASKMGVSYKTLLANVQGINKAFGGINVINDKNIGQFEDQLRLANDLVRGFGLSSDEVGALTNNANIAGTSMERITYEVMNQTSNLEKSGIYLSNQNQVLHDIAKMSKFNAAMYGKSAKALSRAATAAHILGTNIETQLEAGSKLLDIENSIQNEMRARALIGADINYDAIRLAELNGDVEGVIRGQVAAFEKVGDLTKKNRVAVQAFADSMGMGRDEAIQMSQNLALAQKAGLDLNAFLNNKISDADLQKAAQTLSGEEKARFEAMIQQKKSIAIQAEFDEALESVKAALIPMLGPLSTMLSGIAKAVKLFSDLTGGFGPLVVVGIALYKGFMAIRRAMQAVVQLAEQAVANNMGGGGLGDLGSTGGGGGRKKPGGLGRIGTAFKKGGLRGGMKAMGRMAGAGLSSVAGVASAAQANLGVGTGTTAGAAAGSTSAVGNVAAKGGILGKLGNALKGGFGKALGPIFSGIMGIANISSMVSDARAQAAAGNAPSAGTLGKSLVQSAAYPIANLALNLIPGFGTIASIADGILGMMGMSPIQWITDNLIGLVPDTAFTGLGDMALGDSAKAAAPSEIKVNDFMLDTHPNDKIGGVLDNRSVEGMLGYLEQMVMLLGERQHVVLSDSTVEAIHRKGAARKSFRR
jgi:hypothetical protein